MNANPSAQKVQELFLAAVTKLQEGDAKGARKGLEKVSRMAPNSPSVWYNLALTSQYLDLHSRAIQEYERSLKLSPNQVEALVNLGLSYRSINNMDAALASVRKALQLVPSHSRALNLLGSLLGESGDTQGAMECFHKSLGNEPDHPDARENLAHLARNCCAEGKYSLALDALGPLFHHSGSTLEEQLLYGEILVGLGQFDPVAQVLENLKARFPGVDRIQNLELLYYESIGEYFQAIPIAKTILEEYPESSQTWDTLGRIYFELNGIEESRACYEKAIDLDPKNSDYRNHLGLNHAAMGDRLQAENHYRAAISLDPDHIEAYWNLVNMKKFTSSDDPDVKALEALWQRLHEDEDARCRLAFALGKVYDDCADHDRAIAFYGIGNQTRANEIERNGFDFDQYFGHMERISKVFVAPPRVVADRVHGMARPIFVLGMFRSGTTLVEQILSRHPEVTGRGELPCVERAIARLEKTDVTRRVYPDDFPEIGKAEWNREAQKYGEWITGLQDLDTPCFTDKMPFNFAHIWLIKALFPEAIVVHCERHPLDVILSNYFQWFGTEIQVVYSLETLARFYIAYHRLMRHWHWLFPGEIIRVQYENLIADRENQVRELIRQAELEWDDRCLSRADSTTAIRTASIWQARQEIYTTAQGRWRNYARFLSPAIRVLQEEGILGEVETTTG